jgi:Secretion system C-terminal sorting domain
MRFLLAAWMVVPAFARGQEAIRIQNGAILTVQSGANLTVNGGITLDNGSKLNHAGIITVRQYGASGSADWTDNSTTAYNYGSGTTIFNSPATQTISSLNSFGQVTVNTAGLNLGANATASTWLLITGVITTNAYKVIASSTAATAIQADAGNPGYVNGWINGNVRRYIAPATVDSYDFPIGQPDRSNVATLANLNASPLTGTQYLDVYFGAKPGNDNGLVVTEDGQPYIDVNTGGVWHLSPDAEPSGGKFDLLLYFEGFSGLQDNEFGLLERPDGSSDAADWTVPAGSTLPEVGDAGRTVAGGYARRNGLTAFSQWGIGQTATPLPVTLIDFQAQRVSRSLVDLSWETAMEENSKGFEVERELDSATVFTAEAFVPSEAPGGNSSVTLSYTYTDTNSYSGVSYYRLLEEDLNGRWVYSAVRAVSGSGNDGITVTLFPNPGHGQFTLRVEGTSQPYSVLITDVQGHAVRRIDAVGSNDISVPGLSQGVYFVHIPGIFGNGRGFVQKVLIVP